MTTFDHTQGKPVGTKCFGNREVRGASDKQAALIDRLLAEREFDLADLRGVDLSRGGKSVNIRHASRVIDYLKLQPFRSDLPEPSASEKAINYARSLIAKREGGEHYADFDLATTPRSMVSSIIDTLRNAPERVCQLEVGAYRHDGVIYSVRSNIDNERKYAVHIVEVEPNVWDWSARDYALPFVITPDERLTLKEAIEFAAQTGRCVHCGRVLTDPKSIIAGMGKTCASKYE